ncbi:phage portal protein [Weissella confusa]|uniref:phage portal protein n=1 Tax=Weissella confusa TaxID=1583 RepID=UPI0022E1B9EA|nr:phage portal protein [Weissella confusa]
MNILNSIFNPSGEVRSSQSIGTSNLAPFVISGNSLKPAELVSANVALKNSDLYAVTSLISADIAGAPFKGNSPFIELLNQPSTKVSSYNHWQTYLLNVLLNGNGIMLIKRKPDGTPVELINVPTSSVVIDLDDVTGEITYKVNSFAGLQSGTYPASDVIHTRIMAYGSNPLDNLLGHSPLESLSTELQQQAVSNRLSLATIRNAINPATVLKLPEAGQMTDEAKEAVRKSFESANSGDNSGRTIILDETANLSSISINADVAKYLSQLDWGRTQIAKAFGIPDSYLNGSGDQQSSLNMISALYVNGLNKYIEPMLSELNMKLGGGINIDMQSITDYGNQQLTTNLINLVDKGIVGTEEAHTILQSKGVI